MTGFNGNQHRPAAPPVDPPPPPIEPVVITSENAPTIYRALRRFDTLADRGRRARARTTILKRYGVDPDRLRCKLARYERAGERVAVDTAIAEAKAQLEAQKQDATGQPVKGKPDPVNLHTANAIAARKARAASHRGSLGVAEVAVTPAAKRGRPRARP